MIASTPGAAEQFNMLYVQSLLALVLCGGSCLSHIIKQGDIRRRRACRFGGLRDRTMISINSRNNHQIKSS